MPNYVDPMTQIIKDRELRLFPEPPYTIEEIMELSTQHYRSLKNNNYLVTFTKKNDVEPSKWFDAVLKQLSKIFISGFIVGFEHLESNMHAHAYIECTKYVQKREFATYEKNIGYIDLRIVKKDNGVSEYISKENRVYSDIEELKKDKINILTNNNAKQII